MQKKKGAGGATADAGFERNTGQERELKLHMEGEPPSGAKRSRRNSLHFHLARHLNLTLSWTLSQQNCFCVLSSICGRGIGTPIALHQPVWDLGGYNSLGSMGIPSLWSALRLAAPSTRSIVGPHDTDLRRGLEVATDLRRRLDMGEGGGLMQLLEGLPQMLFDLSKEWRLGRLDSTSRSVKDSTDTKLSDALPGTPNSKSWHMGDTTLDWRLGMPTEMPVWPSISSLASLRGLPQSSSLSSTLDTLGVSAPEGLRASRLASEEV